MCNKCDTPATKLLIIAKEFNHLKAMDMASWKGQMRLAIKRNNRTAAEIGGYQHNGELWARDNRKHDKATGYMLAHAKSTAFKVAARVPTTLVDFEAVMHYVNALSHLQTIKAELIEPELYKAKAALNGGEWESISLAILIDNDSQPYKRQYVLKMHQTAGYLHMLHISKDNHMQVAYFPSMRHLHEGRVVKTKLGKYLSNFRELYELTDADIKDMTEKHAATMSARSGWTVEFIEHSDDQGWVDIYDMQGVETCMKNEIAVRVYANEKSELRLAYIRTGGQLVARCIVRDDPTGESTGWLRVYPDPNGYAEGRFMKDWLEANGYPKRTNLDGCLLKAVAVNDGYVCPYLDVGNDGEQTVGTTYRDGTEYLLVGASGYGANNTNGYTDGGDDEDEDEDMRDCEDCGESNHGDDMTYIEGRDGSVCDCCRNANYVYAYGGRYQEWMPTEDCVEVNGTWYETDTAHNHDIYICDASDEWMHSDDMVTTAGGYVGNDYATYLDHSDSDGNEYALTNDVCTLSDGTTCHKDDEEKLQATIDFDTQDADPSDDGVANETTGAL